VESKKNDITEFIYKTERVTDIENKLMVTRGESRGGGTLVINTKSVKRPQSSKKSPFYPLYCFY